MRFFLFTIGFLLACCSPTQRTIISAKKTLKGDWVLSNINYDRSGTFDVTLYNDASAECMKGSIWKFIPNNNTGMYQVQNCTSTGAKNFRFTIPNPDKNGTYSFLFKPINEKKKSTTNNKGYRMSIQHLDDTKMVWTQTINFEGSPFKITMNFDKKLQ